MKKLRNLLAAQASLAVLLTSLFAGTASAATTTATGTGSGYRVSPVVTNLTLNKGQTQNLTVYISNVTGQTENLQVQANDFQPRDETGTPALLLNGASLPQHGLKQYLTVPSKTLSVAPGQQVPVAVQIKLPTTIASGGYYGAVRFVPASNGSSNDTVSLSASVASLILVRVAGPVNEDLSVSSFQVTHNGSAHTIFTNGKNLQALVRFANTGDVQEQPYGKVQLKKGSRIVGLYEINNTDPRGNVLPSSIRRFSVNLSNVGSFGKYTVQGSFGYGLNGQVVNAQTTFYVIPVTIMILIVVAVLLILFLIFGLPRLIRNYNRRILSRAGRR